MAALTIADLTQSSVAGTGVFDALMRSVKAQLDQEFTQGRIKGPEYSTVYLGSLQLAMQTGLTFLLQKDKNDLEAQLLTKQIELADKQVLIAAKELEIATAKALNIPKEGALLDAQASKVTQETTNLVSQELLIDAEKDLKVQQKLNAVTENLVLLATECKLKGEFDLLVKQILRTAEEILLLTQKTATEKAQTQAVGVDADSVVGKQKALYTAQTSGFARDAEQKVAKVLVDTWSVRRTTDEAVAANSTNKLDDATVGRAIDKLLTGVGA
jgi:hypothetical protein